MVQKYWIIIKHIFLLDKNITQYYTYLFVCISEIKAMNTKNLSGLTEAHGMSMNAVWILDTNLIWSAHIILTVYRWCLFTNRKIVSQILLSVSKRCLCKRYSFLPTVKSGFSWFQKANGTVTNHLVNALYLWKKYCSTV